MQANLCSIFQRLTISPCCRANFSKINGTFARIQHAPTPNPVSVCVQQVRGVGVFKQAKLTDLWKSITVVSKSGMRRGRGRRSNVRLITELNTGKKMGDGELGILWPGLNATVIKGKEMSKNPGKMTGSAEERAKKLAEKRQESLSRRRVVRYTHPLERGFSGTKMEGTVLGPEANVRHEDFKYVILKVKALTYMCPNFGRKMCFTSTVACGNGKGVIGVATGRGMMRMSSVQSACKKAIKKLLYIPRIDDRSILHDFYTQYYRSKIFVSQKPEGYGLKCHRLLRKMCELIGIKDLHAQCEGSDNHLNVIKAFLLGLVRQRSYEDMVREKKLHLVKIDKQRRNLPVVLASPEVCRRKEEIPSSENLDFQQFTYGGRVRLIKKKPPPFYESLPSWQNFLNKNESQRGKRVNKWQLMARHGGIKSYLSGKFPEAKACGH